MTQQIASFVDSDQDLIHFRQSCRCVSDALEGDGSSFWRRRFLAKFEKPLNFKAKKWNNLEYKKQYQRRRLNLRTGALFKLGRSNQERECLLILRDMIKGTLCPRSDSLTLLDH